MNNQLKTHCLSDGRQIFCLNTQEVPVLEQQVKEYFKHGITVKKGDTIFDVGANIGLFSLMINDICEKQVKIFAFEPIPNVFQILQENTKSIKEIMLFQLAIGKQSHIVEMTYYPNATAISSIYPDTTGIEQRQIAKVFKENIHSLPFPQKLVGLLPEFAIDFLIERLSQLLYISQKVKCQTKTLSQIVHKHSITQIDLLKIDVEKAELDVLDGIAEDDWLKIKQVVVEVHDIEHRVDKITALLKSHSFVVICKQDFVLRHLNIHTIYATRK